LETVSDIKIRSSDMPFGIQPWHIVVIIIVALIIFGPSKLPELGRTIGKTLNEFRTGAREMTESMKEEINRSDDRPAPVQPANATQAEPATPTIRPPVQSISIDSSTAQPGNFCTQCGAANPADARFCKNCGKALQA
jgi:sec-independent protein translocase protein TatA